MSTTGSRDFSASVKGSIDKAANMSPCLPDLFLCLTFEHLFLFLEPIYIEERTFSLFSCFFFQILIDLHERAALPSQLFEFLRTVDQIVIGQLQIEVVTEFLIVQLSIGLLDFGQGVGMIVFSLADFTEIVVEAERALVPHSDDLPLGAFGTADSMNFLSSCKLTIRLISVFVLLLWTYEDWSFGIFLEG